MQAGIILAGQPLDVVGSLSRGQVAGAQIGDIRHAQDYRNALSQYGAGALNGDPTSMNALAGFDPAAVQGLQSNALGMDATRQNMAVQTETLELARQESARAARAEVANLSAAEAAAARDRLSQAVQGASAATDEAQWNGFLQSQGYDPAQYPFAQKDMILASVLGAVDALEMQVTQAEMAAGPELPAAVQALEWRAQQAGLQPGTPEYQSFIRENGGGNTTNINMGGDAGEYLYGTDAGVPAGWRVHRTTGVASVIPGGPAAAEAAAGATAAGVAEGRRDTSTDVIVSAAAAAREAAEGRTLGGVLGGVAAMNPASLNAELYRQVDVLKSNATVSNLQAMRDASPTGGAMGALSDKEGQMLADQAGALDPASPYFQRDLDAYERTLLRTVHGPEAGDRIFQQTRAPTTLPAESGFTPVAPQAAAPQAAGVPVPAGTGPSPEQITPQVVQIMPIEQLRTLDVSRLSDEALDAVIARLGGQ